jgi:transcriptional repressor BetI
MSRSVESSAAVGQGDKRIRVKRSIEAIRRQDLIEAAYETFLEHGVTGATVARISRAAGMSHGIVNYYFKSKDELLNGVVRYANRMVTEEVAELLRRARTPRERISSIVKGNFTAKAFNRQTANAWISFYAMVPLNKEFERLQRLVYRRLNSNLMHDLRKLCADKDARRIAAGIAVMIDGLWMRVGMDGGAMDRNFCIALIDDYIEKSLAAVAPGN